VRYKQQTTNDKLQSMLLTYEEALGQILGATNSLVGPGERIALGTPGPIRVLADSLVATSDHPRFDNSAVDGYAFNLADLDGVGLSKPVAFTVATGPNECPPLAPGLSARIFTGARLPTDTAAVAMQEDVDVSDGRVKLREALPVDQGLRRAGTDFRAGDLLLPAGTPINPGVAGLLASQGLTRPHVKALPRCIVITTGDEIVSPECEPGPAELRDSIGAMLTHAGGRYATVSAAFASDDPSRLGKVLAHAAEHADAVFIAGGASVGDRDFTARVVAELGQVEFHGINVRPGKPLLFGHVNGKPVVGLPGNPASAYVCFHLFGVPLVRRLGGWPEPNHHWLEAPYGGTHPAEARDVFARVTLGGGVATPVHEQASFGLKSLGAAQALARLPAGKVVAAGDVVRITLL